jgi:hypothetical protein
MAAAADAVVDPDDDLIALGSAETFVAGEDIVRDGGGEFAAVGFDFFEFGLEIGLAGIEEGEGFGGGGLGLGGAGGAGGGLALSQFDLFHEFEFLVFDLADGVAGGVDFVGEGAVFLVLFGLVLLEGVAFDLFLFGLDVELEFFAGGFEFHDAVAGGFGVGFGLVGSGEGEGALWGQRGEFSAQLGDSAVAVLEDQEVFQRGEHGPRTLSASGGQVNHPGGCGWAGMRRAGDRLIGWGGMGRLGATCARSFRHGSRNSRPLCSR